MSYSKVEETNLKKLITNEKINIFKESSLNLKTAEIDSTQLLKNILIKNKKLLKDSIERSAVSNIPPVKLLITFLYIF